MVAPVFIDAAGAADILHLPLDAVLDLISEGRLNTYGGKAANPFVRSAEVSVLAAELGTGSEAGDETPRRVKSASARVQTRITADSRWSEITPDDIGDWARRADFAKRQAACTAATTAIDRLQRLLRALDEVPSPTRSHLPTSPPHDL